MKEDLRLEKEEIKASGFSPCELFEKIIEDSKLGMVDLKKKNLARMQALKEARK